MRAVICAILLGCALLVGRAAAQVTDAYSRKNTFTLFAEGSTPSTPILVGTARQRLMLDAGGAYTRRVVRFWGSDLGYHVELRPLIFESDPLSIDNYIVTEGLSNPPYTLTYTGLFTSVDLMCKPQVITFVEPPSSTFAGVTQINNITCGRQWTFGQSFAPFGFKYSMRTHNRAQPFVIGTLGYLYTSRPVPVANAEAFNFVVNFGVGVEVYRVGKRSISLETRLQHFSNRDTAQANPGTDNLMFKASYSFGR